MKERIETKSEPVSEEQKVRQVKVYRDTEIRKGGKEEL
jgi:hypothetical protein